ncbi:fungal-specific transcription factor domain-domain-containing protein [Protomyces lactucae-debilis]|uniref:Fungal-specific transcription factor domain-domain-containing protein n=1 Tax=Protomyces lactucae-debilis TaxID=2754530 RepID=A0A1Y2FDD0_PROLT|nr:fungal-specific transcription factor domain-containing protein [Protomyces lactucae-debilis]ORY80855.1 fungal-specific transcription factor domain-domain-containing protein [Protomyces lactucae-debilis]
MEPSQPGIEPSPQPNAAAIQAPTLAPALARRTSVARPMRTPIACTNCRKSKIKCHHRGVPPCRHCEKTKRECIIPEMIHDDYDAISPGQSPAPVKRKSTAPSAEGSSASFKKSRYEVGHTGLPCQEILEEAVELYMQHFNNDIFSFFHKPTFLRSLRNNDVEPVLMLGVLTLSARFCNTVVKDFENEAAACEYFCKKTLALLVPDIDKPSVTRIQALLMVGLHLWGASQGAAAFIYVGVAIRMAQVLDLGSEGSYPPRNKLNSTEWIVTESRRRTFWSAYLMDRFLSNGRGRPLTISNSDISIPLPADNLNFTYGTPEAERHLNEDLQSVEILPECTGTMAMLIELVDIWSRMAQWSCARRWLQDELAPWDPASEFFQVDQMIGKWHARLPKSLRYNEHTTLVQLSQRHTSWALMHIVYYNGLLFTHRSYLTFAPTKQDPKGPREAADRGWVEPEGFWKRSAHTCFSAAEQIIELNRQLLETGNALTTPFLLFSVFSAANILAYLDAFPWVDPAISPRARTLYELGYHHLDSVKHKWRMVVNWTDTLTKLFEIHHKFAREGRTAHTTTDYFAEYRSKVLDFGNLHQVPMDLPQQRSRDEYSNMRGTVAISTGSEARDSSLHQPHQQAADLLHDDGHVYSGSKDTSPAMHDPSLLPRDSQGLLTHPSPGLGLHDYAPFLAFDSNVAGSAAQHANGNVNDLLMDPHAGLMSIHEGSLLAFMQGDSWSELDALDQEWSALMTGTSGSGSHGPSGGYASSNVALPT